MAAQRKAGSVTPIIVDDEPVEIEDINFEECPMLQELLEIVSGE